jgi:hypothetical protein
LNLSQRLKVGDARAMDEVEFLKSMESSQRLQVREHARQKECFELREVSQAGRKLAQGPRAEMQALGPGFTGLRDLPL